MVVWMSCVLSSSSLFQAAKEKMYIDQAGHNPLKKMWRVMVFALNNKHPLNRSAFTYCEENTPTRLNLGKQQYGGPFTFEEVEDVKTFFRLLLLLVTLFGYHIAGDGFAASQHMKLYSCPSSIVWGVIVFNPSFKNTSIMLYHSSRSYAKLPHMT